MAHRKKTCKVCKCKYVIPKLMGIPLWQGYVDGYCSMGCKAVEQEKDLAKAKQLSIMDSINL